MIKFVYFDVGGVLIKDLSSDGKWNQMMRDLGISSQAEKEFEQYFVKYEKNVNLGKENVECLVPLIEKRFGLHFPKDYSLLNDFANRFEKNESILSVIKKVRSKYKIGLLTNTYPGLQDLHNKRGIMPDVEWDVVIDSSVEGVLKPQKEIYELAQKRAGVNAGEILFVENTKRHVDAAKKLGWQTFLYDSSDMDRASKQLSKVIV